MVSFPQDNNIVKIFDIEISRNDYNGLLEFIEKSISSGTSFSQISLSLISNGWPENVIEFIIQNEFAGHLLNDDGDNFALQNLSQNNIENNQPNQITQTDLSNYVSKKEALVLVNKIKELEDKMNSMSSNNLNGSLNNSNSLENDSNSISDSSDDEKSSEDKDSEISDNPNSIENLGEDVKRFDEDLKTAVKDFNIFSGKLESNDSKLVGFDEKISIQKDLVGELRGMVMSTDKRMAEFEGKFEKANLIIGDFDPQVLEKRFSLMEKKIDINESNTTKALDKLGLVEESLKNYKDLMKKIKSFDSMFEVLDNLKQKVSDLKDIEKVVERKTGKVEIIFGEFSDKLETLNKVKNKTEAYDEMIKDLIKDMDSMTTKIKGVITKDDFVKKIETVNSDLEYVKSVVYDLNKAVGGNVKVSGVNFLTKMTNKNSNKSIEDLKPKKTEEELEQEELDNMNSEKSSDEKIEPENSTGDVKAPGEVSGDDSLPEIPVETKEDLNSEGLMDKVEEKTEDKVEEKEVSESVETKKDIKPKRGRPKKVRNDPEVFDKKEIIEEIKEANLEEDVLEKIVKKKRGRPKKEESKKESVDTEDKVEIKSETNEVLDNEEVSDLPSMPNLDFDKSLEKLNEDISKVDKTVLSESEIDDKEETKNLKGSEEKIEDSKSDKKVEDKVEEKKSLGLGNKLKGIFSKK